MHVCMCVYVYLCPETLHGGPRSEQGTQPSEDKRAAPPGVRDATDMDGNPHAW